MGPRDRIMTPLIAAGLFGRVYGVIETTGRTSGQARRTPIGGHLDGHVYWLVAETGDRAQYVRNLKADPQVRVRVGRRWYDGTATVLPDDDGIARRASIDQSNGLLGKLDGRHFLAKATNPLTVRVDLEATAS